VSARRNDLDIYEQRAADWWDESAPTFRSLRSINAYRLAHIDAACAAFLSRATVVDLGCGGGLLVEPLSTRAARVIGVDLSRRSLGAARRHGSGARARRLYVAGDCARAPLCDGCADLVVLGDVIEHLRDPAATIGEAARLLRAGGYLFVSTINRTARARFLAVTLAERLGYVPRGTHDPRMFVRPDELRAAAQQHGLTLLELGGDAPRLGRALLRRTIALRPTRSTAVAYRALFVKRNEMNESSSRAGKAESRAFAPGSHAHARYADRASSQASGTRHPRS
jgi:2-polyprenyl-6-hydroxyphenyl methylase/3-demethylubiquinone-9 3-methyltransferase